MRHRKRVFSLIGIVAALAILISPGAHGETFKGKLSIGVHEVDMKANTVYMIKAEGDKFRPNVSIRPGFLPYVRTDSNKRYLYQSYYAPNKNEKITFNVGVNTLFVQGKGPHSYTLEITPLALAGKPLLNVQDSLTKADPPYKQRIVTRKHHKSYPIKMAGGKFYVIDMMRRGQGIDCYLYLEDAKGKVIQSNDDGGEGLNSRIVIRPDKAGDYRIIATHLGENGGDYTLTVRSEGKD